MTEARRDTAWGPMEVHFAAAREAFQAVQEAGFPVLLEEPNLPVFAEEGESKRLAKKGKDEPREWRGDPFLLLQDRSRILELLTFLRDRQGFEMLVDCTGVDYDAEDPELWVVYGLLSLRRKCRLTVKVLVPKEDPRIASVTGVYPAADWHEREAAEFFGLVFEGHPDPRHMLLPDDWEGHPLRKDYEFPEEYHGISCV